MSAPLTSSKNGRRVLLKRLSPMPADVKVSVMPPPK